VRGSLGADPAPAHLTGPSCDSQDTILFDVSLSRGLAPGDRVFIESAGAYTTVYASSFNGFDVPLVSAVERSVPSGTHGPPSVG
jgi:ornithine decarboxylase